MSRIVKYQNIFKTHYSVYKIVLLLMHLENMRIHLYVINLNWLPVAENTEFNVSKLAYQGLHDKNWPEYLPIKLIKRRRNLRSNKSGRLNTVKRMLSSKRLMKSSIRYQLILECDKKSFINKARSFCKDKACLGYCPYKVFSIFLFIWSIWYFRLTLQF